VLAGTNEFNFDTVSLPCRLHASRKVSSPSSTRKPSNRSNTSEPDNNLWIGVPGSCSPYREPTKSVGTISGGNIYINSDSNISRSFNNVAYVSKSTGSNTERKIVLIPVSFNSCNLLRILSLDPIRKTVTLKSFFSPCATKASANAVSRSDSPIYQYARNCRDFKYLIMALARPDADNVIPIVPTSVTNVASSV
jgi:hypothetical protein